MKKIALAGNPNVGKSTVFNALTGMHQHTGNWPGKTVSNATGTFTYKNEEYKIYDLPGTYSLVAHSQEEEVARDFICSNEYDAVIVVCDATCLERNLNLVLQILEITNKVVVCVNLMDEAKKKKIEIDLKLLSDILKVPVIGTSARNDKSFDKLINAVDNLGNGLKITYNDKIEEVIEYLGIPRAECMNAINNSSNDPNIKHKLEVINDNIDFDIKKEIVGTLINKAEEISNKVVKLNDKDYTRKDRKIDKILTNKITGIPIMLLMLMGIFYLTITFSNYPSEILFNMFSKLEVYLSNLFPNNFISNILIDGIYKVLTWVISVMLPPMTIFFPLFTLLEDLGVLPRIAFNLDNVFKKSNACGKQSLTMCMGFGCNAVGVTGARIIDSKRERLIAILTNVFVPCNGRFPTIIAIISMFFIGTTKYSTLLSTVILTSVILLGIVLTLLTSYILSKTILKGYPSSFTLELPPYRKPQIGKIIVRSIFDRTLFVLGRAIVVAAPAGAFIWLMANIIIDNNSLLFYASNFLNPFGKLIGMDGVIILAFLLGFPANEIVIPIIIMCYLSKSSIVEFDNLETLKNLLVANNWNIITSICVIVFSLCHFPCSTTCLTIKKETNWKWTILAIIIPTLIGIILCFSIKTISTLISLIC